MISIAYELAVVAVIFDHMPARVRPIFAWVGLLGIIFADTLIRPFRPCTPSPEPRLLA